MYWILDGVRFRILFSTNLQWDPIATLWKECGPSQFYKATSYQSSWRVTQGSLVCLTMCFCELGGCTFLKRPVASSWFYKQAQVCSPSSWGNWDPELLSSLPQGSRKMAQLVRCLPHKHEDCAQLLLPTWESQAQRYTLIVPGQAGRARKLAPSGSVDSYSNWISELPVQWGTLSQKDWVEHKLRKAQNVSVWLPHTSTHPHTCTHARTHPHTSFSKNSHCPERM